MDRTAAVDLALDWLARSDIRWTGSFRLSGGGVNQGYNWRKRSYPFVYSEITGYAVSLFVNAYRWTGDEGFLTLAQQSADFLLGVQALADGDLVRGALPQGLSLPGLQPRRQYYSFDAAMCLQGLLDMNNIRPAPKLLASARAIGDWLIERMQQESGAFLSVIDARTGASGQGSGDVFGDGGCLHAKHAIGLLKLSQATGDGRYRRAAGRVCDWVLGLQDGDGAFRTTEGLTQVVSHSHCYATEGLLFAHHEMGIERYLGAARRAGEWLLDVQNRDGSINIAYKRRWWRMGRRVIEKLRPRRVTDATAQAIRIWLILYYLSGTRRFLDACYRASHFLVRMQCASSPDRNAVGGFYYWSGHPVIFSWCAMFALHALYALEHFDRPKGYKHLMAELF